MRRIRGIRLLAVAVLGLLLAGCTGLPTSGPPNPGLAIGGEEDTLIYTPIASGPKPGDSPEGIVKGFLEASMTPADNWGIAQEFLTDDFRPTWKPGTLVTIDESVLQRKFQSSLDSDDKSAKNAEVHAQFDQVANVDASGAYNAESGLGKATYQLKRVKGEWRIAKAADGIVLDAETFGQVYQKYALKYFDTSWSHLVPDVRWFPRRTAMATSVARALISGKPSDWLAPAVRNAFTEDITLAGDAVTVDSSQVATVALSRSALSASASDLARMRTQLEGSLSGAGVAEVRFTVDGAPLEAGTVPLDENVQEAGVLVQNAETFGRAVSGDTIEPVGGLTAQIAKITAPIRAVDVSLDAALASVQLQDGSVWALADGNSTKLDARADLIEPSLDPFGFTWTVPRGAPGELLAWGVQGPAQHLIADAWPGYDSISQLRVAADGARVAAVVTQAGQRRLVVAAVLRGKSSEPTALGQPHAVSTLAGPTLGLGWVGSDTLAVLSSTPDPALTMYPVGGPSVTTAPPDAAAALAGAKATTGLRVLGSDGSVYAQRGSSWQVSVEGIRVLGTRAGY
ncbi:LpqB family beta-propeller domain-containing protein [Microbacterium arabinogalactanolyticum]|uniref:LpqB family beta-propeller domain-containing protein n=1 Tax=Microbacterium arabinogalactanolyticum TaxID=69365 RepID=UPI002556D684|nr:LpqB family beta-propeller domain-containing protein [Microbacterium arabinogalactanolyticum]GLC84884.1 lipoprotein LpqB [Microbacterium arabinogalactanolyticum]